MFDDTDAREECRSAMELISRRISRGDARPGDADKLAAARMEVAQGRYERALLVIRGSANSPEHVSTERGFLQCVGLRT